MSILVFFLVLFVLVLVHEWGHFIVAKKSGMRVDEFGIGFPPKLFGWRKGETEYTFNMLPIGGFVRIFGEDPDQHETSETLEGSFSSKSRLAQAAVLVAGIAMNILFAWMLFAVAMMIGVQSFVSEDVASDAAQLTIAQVLTDSPAHAVGLLPGDTIQSVTAGTTTLEERSPSAFTSFVSSHGDVDMVVAYTRSGETENVTMRPEIGVLDEDAERRALGVALVLSETVAKAPHYALYESAVLTVVSLRDIAIGIGTLLFDAVRLQADLSQVAGPVGIVGLVDDASALGVTTLLMFTAFISLNLAVINILPFPALDGGRLVIVAIEAIKGGPIKPQVVNMVNMFGFILLIVLMLVVTWNDIARIL